MSVLYLLLQAVAARELPRDPAASPGDPPALESFRAAVQRLERLNHWSAAAFRDVDDVEAWGEELPRALRDLLDDGESFAGRCVLALARAPDGPSRPSSPGARPLTPFYAPSEQWFVQLAPIWCGAVCELAVHLLTVEITERWTAPREARLREASRPNDAIVAQLVLRPAVWLPGVTLATGLTVAEQVGADLPDTGAGPTHPPARECDSYETSLRAALHDIWAACAAHPRARWYRAPEATVALLVVSAENETDRRRGERLLDELQTSIERVQLELAADREEADLALERVGAAQDDLRDAGLAPDEVLEAVRDVVEFTAALERIAARRRPRDPEDVPRRGRPASNHRRILDVVEQMSAAADPEELLQRAHDALAWTPPSVRRSAPDDDAFAILRHIVAKAADHAQRLHGHIDIASEAAAAVGDITVAAAPPPAHPSYLEDLRDQLATLAPRQPQGAVR